ncbi:adenosine receptor A3-like [Actinia tenebrosa]|uniref:Adenosine receptor A3-like n=1 Tax=Actinia tenebrosa TaxID=6105 RepID=A0A6P8HL04_ACTTE|nr:adenosine receptor A3-like [Actinia tenebrosa]
MMSDRVWSLTSSAVFSTVFSILLLTGIVGNILVVIVTTRRNTRLLPGGVFIRSLAISDAGGSANIIFMLITIICRGGWVFGHVGCQLSGTFIVLFGSSSLHLLCIISINRYLKIAKTSLYRRVFNKTGTIILLIIPWVLPLVMSVVPVFGWSAHEYQFSKCICHFYFSTSLSYTITFLIAVVATPLSISAIYYVNMYFLIRSHTSSMKNLQRKSPAANIEEIRSARTIFVLIVAFILCYTPASIINILQMAGYDVPPYLDLISSMTLIVSKHAQNPLLYGILNRRYRKELIKIARLVVRSCCCRKWCPAVENEEESQSKRRSNTAGNSVKRQRPSSVNSLHGCPRIVRRDNSPRLALAINPRHSCGTHPRLVVEFRAS